VTHPYPYIRLIIRNVNLL